MDEPAFTTQPGPRGFRYPPRHKPDDQVRCWCSVCNAMFKVPWAEYDRWARKHPRLCPAHATEGRCAST